MSLTSILNTTLTTNKYRNDENYKQEIAPRFV